MKGTGQQVAFEAVRTAVPKGRSPQAHLLHALNQPLTGLQCSLELALAGPRSREQYIRTLREGLELTSRMRILVEAMRELIDTQEEDVGESTSIRLDTLLRDTADELRPVAETRNVRLQLACETELPICGAHRRLGALLFRFLDSVLGLASKGSNLCITATPERGQSVVVVCFEQATLPEYSPFSPAELGLLIAQEGWERLGGEWIHTPEKETQTFMLQLPLAASQPNRGENGDRK
jgi:C4-dicarboxylate-specific signal transduction histidine kinase